MDFLLVTFHCAVKGKVVAWLCCVRQTGWHTFMWSEPIAQAVGYTAPPFKVGDYGLFTSIHVLCNGGVMKYPECDISVSRLPGLETFANFLVVSVSENMVSKKKSRYRYRKIWSRKKSLGIGIDKFGLVRKVSVSVSENLVSEKKSRYRSQKIWFRKKVTKKKWRKLARSCL